MDHFNTKAQTIEVCYCYLWLSVENLVWVNRNLQMVPLDHSWISFVISCSPGWATCQNLWSTPCGYRFQPAGAVTKINDLIFVVLAEWQDPCPGWLTLSAVCHSRHSPLPISQIALILSSLPPLAHPRAHSLWSKVVASSGPSACFSSHWVRTCKAASKCVREFLTFSCSVLVAWLGVGFLGEREEEPGELAADSAADTSSDLYLFLQP